MKRTLCAWALAALSSSPAYALDFISASTTGGTVVTDYSTTGRLSFDLDLASFDAATLRLAVTPGDLGRPIAFDAVVRNFTGLGIQSLTFNLDPARFGTVGSVTRSFGGTTAIAARGGQAVVAFEPREFLDILVGSPLGGVGGSDWAIASTGLRPGDTLTLSVVAAVPESETYALMAAGLGVLAFVGRRRRARLSRH